MFQMLINEEQQKNTSNPKLFHLSSHLHLNLDSAAFFMKFLPCALGTISLYKSRVHSSLPTSEVYLYQVRIIISLTNTTLSFFYLLYL